MTEVTEDAFRMHPLPGEDYRKGYNDGLIAGGEPSPSSPASRTAASD